MPVSESLTLSIALNRLSQSDPNHYAIWVLESPFPGGYAHHDRIWDDTMASVWQGWQQFFSLRELPRVPHVPSAYVPQFLLDSWLDQVSPPSPGSGGYTGRLMQGLGVSLWDWLFDGPIRQSLERSLGMAMGQNQPLHLQLDIRAPELIAIPWEIMQPQPGRPAVSLDPQIRFSRTTSDVDPLTPVPLDASLQILLVLGQDDLGSVPPSGRSQARGLHLPQEAEILKNLLELSASQINAGTFSQVHCQVHALVEPDPQTLVTTLESGSFNVFFYAGHGVPAPDGGQLFLRAGITMGGTELAQILTRCQIRLAVFNTCWGAQPDQQEAIVIPRSSLAEVLLHHGLPAVLAMRESIADEEALSFIQAFAQGLAERKAVTQAMAVARQQLVALYQFNHPAWTLPVLYLHPQFSGELLRPAFQDVTQIPGQPAPAMQTGVLRSLDAPHQAWPIQGGMIRIGRLPDNDLVISEPWVSQHHAEIFSRSGPGSSAAVANYYLKDMSRFGSFYFDGRSWQPVHRKEVPLTPGTRVRFGSLEGQLMEFTLEGYSHN
jgi:hypothetical protein